jgi:hypothetical protein
MIFVQEIAVLTFPLVFQHGPIGFAFVASLPACFHKNHTLVIAGYFAKAAGVLAPH